MCNRYATSREHVPPKGFFPDGHRDQLITVPSCPLHNSSKSGDDEYLRAVLSSAITSSDLARDEIYPKIKRSIKKAPGKIGFYKNLQPAKFGGIETGAFEVDMPRVLTGLEQISRGLFYHEYGTKWLGNLTIVPPYGPFRRFDSTPPQKSIGYSLQQEEYVRKYLEESSDEVFSDSPNKGSNPEVFYYQILETPPGYRKIFRLVFFDGVSVIVYFGDPPSNS